MSVDVNLELRGSAIYRSGQWLSVTVPKLVLVAAAIWELKIEHAPSVQADIAESMVVRCLCRLAWAVFTWSWTWGSSTFGQLKE